MTVPIHLPDHLRHAKHRTPHNGCPVCMHKVAEVERAASRIAADVTERLYDLGSIGGRKSI
jgi:hypothetical protein